MSDTPVPIAGDDDTFTPGGGIVPILRRPGDVPKDRRDFVTHLVDRVKEAKRHWEPDFARMTRDMDFASGLQYRNQESYEDTRYRLNLTLRHVGQRVATLYAKNPKAVYRRRPRLDFALWDEKPESLAMAQATMQQAMASLAGPQVDPMTGAAITVPPPDPAAAMQAEALMADYQQGMAERVRAERIGRTLEILWDYFIVEPTPNTKVQMKAMVRRAVTCGVGWVKLRYQRIAQQSPDQGAAIADITSQLAAIERLRAVVADPEAQAARNAEREQLRQALTALQSQPQVIAREGPLLDFPRATAVIPDPNTRSLRGWIGTGWVAEEFVLPAERVQEIYKVDLAGMAARMETPVRVIVRDGSPHIRFWQVYDRDTRRLYTVADGWPDFLEEPRAPEVDLEQFFPYYALTFNEIEHEKRVYPPSDVELLRHVQDEYNRTRESLRQHRIANRPLYAAAAGALDKTDQRSLAGHEAHAIVVLNALKEGQNVGELLQPVQKVPVDPAVYEVESLFADAQRVTGNQEANLGGTSGASATEVSIAESSRMSTVGSEADDMDELLTDIARDFGKVCLTMLSAETVTRIVGRGAMWPEFSADDVAAEISLVVEAGSSGRPNRERDLANLERVAPYILQVPGIKPDKIARYMLSLLDERLDLNDWLDPAVPAITAMNRAAPAAGGPSAPDQQGPQGADNAPNPQQTPGGPQPAYGPSGNDVV
jgi:hypothetical protein